MLLKIGQDRDVPIVTGLVFECLDSCDIRHFCYQKMLSKSKTNERKAKRVVSNKKN